MKNLLFTLFAIMLCFFIACQQTIEPTITGLQPSDFTPFEKIDPNIYFPTPENIANDPNDALMAMFREKKATDMTNREKPRPFPDSTLTKIENISHQQPWTPIQEVFRFDWDKIGAKGVADLSKAVKTRVVFDNPDLKVIELAIAAGAELPLHAQAAPSVYHIFEGAATITSNDSTANVFVGTSIRFDSYAKKRVKVISDEPLKILWFSWAPQGDNSYLQSGYYLTGSNLHFQPQTGIIPPDFDFWNDSDSQPYQIVDAKVNSSATNDFFKNQQTTWETLDKTAFYPNESIFKSESSVDWVDVVNLDPKSFFFAEDLKKLGPALKMMSNLAKIKSVFRVKRPNGGYDFNYSYLTWGPQSKYITHSHAICEFYYLLAGDVEYIINKEKYHGVPGNFYWHPPYYDHEMRGLKEGVPFSSISGSWIPYGKRELLTQPFLLLEDIPENRDHSLPANFDFHDFKMKQGLKYGVL